MIERVQWVNMKTIFDAVPDANIYMVAGKRGNGKTYNTLAYCLEQWRDLGDTFLYVRRIDRMVATPKMRNLLYGHRRTGFLQKILEAKGYDDIVFYSEAFWPATRNEKGKLIRGDEPLGYVASINTWETSKGSPIPHCTTVYFDEFLTHGSYLINEPSMFDNVISTAMRENRKRVIMTANKISWNAPYFREWRLEDANKLQPGQYKVYTIHQSDGSTRKIVYWHTDAEGDTRINSFVNIENTRSRAIATDEWETGDFNRIPEESGAWFRETPCYVQSQDGFALTLQPVQAPDGTPLLFVYTNGRTIVDKYPPYISPLYRDRIVYTDFAVPCINCRFAITKQPDELSKYILSALNQNRVYYQNNTAGENLRYYIKFSMAFSPINI